MTKKQRERLTRDLRARHERLDDLVVEYRLEQLARELMRVPKGHRREDDPLPLDDARAATLTEIYQLDEGSFGLDCLRVLAYEPNFEIDANSAAIKELIEAVRGATLATEELNTHYSFIEKLKNAKEVG